MEEFQPIVLALENDLGWDCSSKSLFPIEENAAIVNNEQSCIPLKMEVEDHSGCLCDFGANSVDHED